MIVNEVIVKIKKIEEDIKRVENKIPKMRDRNTTVELNYMDDIVPLISDAQVLMRKYKLLEIKS